MIIEKILEVKIDSDYKKLSVDEIETLKSYINELEAYKASYEEKIERLTLELREADHLTEKYFDKYMELKKGEEHGKEK